MSIDFMNTLNDKNLTNECININDVYTFRALNRDIYNKADMIGDLTGTIMKVRDVKGINKISIDVSQYSVSLEDSNQNKLDSAVAEINNILVSFVKRFSYLSSLTEEEADKYEYFITHFPMMDVVKCGNSGVITI